jgi:hypothetical protein
MQLQSQLLQMLLLLSSLQLPQQLLESLQQRLGLTLLMTVRELLQQGNMLLLMALLTAPTVMTRHHGDQNVVGVCCVPLLCSS